MRGHVENEFEMYFPHASCLAVVMFLYLKPELLARGLPMTPELSLGLGLTEHCPLPWLSLAGLTCSKVLILHVGFVQPCPYLCKGAHH